MSVEGVRSVPGFWGLRVGVVMPRINQEEASLGSWTVSLDFGRSSNRLRGVF